MIFRRSTRSSRRCMDGGTSSLPRSMRPATRWSTRLISVAVKRTVTASRWMPGGAPMFVGTHDRHLLHVPGREQQRNAMGYRRRLAGKRVHCRVHRLDGFPDRQCVPIQEHQIPQPASSRRFEPARVTSVPELEQAIHHRRFVALWQLDEAETLHRIGSPKTSNSIQQIQIGSNPLLNDRR